MVLDFDTEIEILLFDQEKIVSYKEINNRFNITPKEAQKVLSDFIENRRKRSAGKKSDFSVVYLLILEHKEKKLSNEKDVESFEDEFKIISKQVYSLQLKPITDFNLIYSSNIDASNNTNRKSNLKVMYNPNEPQQENMDASGVKTDESDQSQSSKSQMSVQTNVLKPSNSSNSDKHGINENMSKIIIKEQNSDKETKHQSKEPKVKNEPIEPAAKMVKLEATSEPAVTTTNIASVKNNTAAAKPASKPTNAKNPVKPANQSTLTSFFKKA